MISDVDSVFYPTIRFPWQVGGSMGLWLGLGMAQVVQLLVLGVATLRKRLINVHPCRIV